MNAYSYARGHIQICGEVYKEPDKWMDWICSREPGHYGDHIAYLDHDSNQASEGKHRWPGGPPIIEEWPF